MVWLPVPAMPGSGRHVPLQRPAAFSLASPTAKLGAPKPTFCRAQASPPGASLRAGLNPGKAIAKVKQSVEKGKPIS